MPFKIDLHRYNEVWRKHEMSCIKDLRRRHKEDMARQRQKEPYREVVMENKIAHLRKQLDTSRADKDKQAGARIVFTPYLRALTRPFVSLYCSRPMKHTCIPQSSLKLSERKRVNERVDDSRTFFNIKKTSRPTLRAVANGAVS